MIVLLYYYVDVSWDWVFSVFSCVRGVYWECKCDFLVRDIIWSRFKRGGLDF